MLFICRDFRTRSQVKYEVLFVITEVPVFSSEDKSYFSILLFSRHINGNFKHIKSSLTIFFFFFFFIYPKCLPEHTHEVWRVCHNAGVCKQHLKNSTKGTAPANSFVHNSNSSKHIILLGVSCNNKTTPPSTPESTHPLHITCKQTNILITLSPLRSHPVRCHYAFTIVMIHSGIRRRHTSHPIVASSCSAAINRLPTPKQQQQEQP